MTAVHPQLSPRCVQWRGICRSKTSGKPILTICPMSRATSSTRSVIITKSLCPRISLAWCASCTLMAPSSPPMGLRGREHSNCTSWAQRIVDPKLTPTLEIQLLDFLYGEWGEIMLRYRDIPTHTTDVLDLTSLTVDEFDALVGPFEAAFLQYMTAWTFHGRRRQSR